MLASRALGSAVLFAAALANSPALAGEVVVPNHAPITAGNGGYSTLMHPQERSYQLVVGPEELGGLPVGSRITGITWRRPSWIVYPDWPGAGNTASYANYDVYLSTSNNPPGSLSTTYLDNIGPDVVQVRGGPMSLSGPFFPGGAVTPSVNPFGTLIQFTTPYVYKGGDLLLTIRHTGNGFSSGFLDTLSSPYYQAIGVSSYTQPDNWYNQGLITMKLVFDGPAVVYCTAGTSASGCAASISATGVPSATATSGFTVSTATAEGNKNGIFFYGTNGKQANPWGNGTSFQCVVPPVKRGGLLAGGGNTGACDGTFSQDLNARWCPTCPKPGHNPGAGTVVQAQLWYRDPGNTSNQTTSLSDALEFVVSP